MAEAAAIWAQGEDDPEKTVGPGTWVNFQAWLKAMDIIHGPKVNPGALKWNFDTIRRFWLKGNLEGMLVGSNLRGSRTPDNTNVLTAVRALRESFRQDFRVSRRYRNRIESLMPYRVALLDPISGMRMPASVWGQACLIPTAKGAHIASRYLEEKSGMWYNITSLPEEGDNQIVKKDPGPQKLTFIDAEAGILRITGMDDPYGSYSSVIPCHVVNIKGEPSVPVVALQLQDEEVLGAGMRLENSTNMEHLSPTLKFKVLITIKPGAPNNKGLFHTMPVSPDELRERFPHYRIQDGTGPDLEIYVPSSEVTARFGWRFDKEAEATITELLGLDDPDPTTGGLVDEKGNATVDMPGFWLVNEQRELFNHSRAVAAEAYTSFADTVVGKVATIVPPNDIELKGNMGGATLQVTPAPSGKVNVVHDFAGITRPVSRLGFMSEGARKVVLGIVRFE